jgi:hypothetical protein
MGRRQVATASTTPIAVMSTANIANSVVTSAPV